METAVNILAVGDLHGRHDLLQRLLREVLPLQPADTILVFLGDLIDRGPQSRQVLETLLRLKARLPQTVILRGNHERMLLDALAGRGLGLYLANGGLPTLESYGLTPARLHDFPAEHRRFLEGLPLMYQTATHVFVHAGLRPGRSIAEQDPRDLLWIRDECFNSSHDFGKTVVFGHTHFSEPFLAPGRIGLDTGAGFGGKLTCLALPEGKFTTLG